MASDPVSRLSVLARHLQAPSCEEPALSAIDTAYAFRLLEIFYVRGNSAVTTVL